MDKNIDMPLSAKTRFAQHFATHKFAIFPPISFCYVIFGAKLVI